jgi:hypothetical protein
VSMVRKTAAAPASGSKTNRNNVTLTNNRILNLQEITRCA